MVDITNVTAATKEEFLSKFTGKVKCFDKAYKKEGGDNPEKFALDYLETHMNEGETGYITVVKAQKNTKQKPYKVVKTPKQEGTRKNRLAYVFVNKETGEVIGEYDPADKRPKKTDAIAYAKTLMYDAENSKPLFTGTLTAKIVKKIDNDEIFDLTYTPSLHTTNGEYIVFTKV